MSRGIGVQGVVALLAFVSLAGCSSREERIIVPGQEVPLRDAAQDLGPLNDSRAPMTISVSLQPRDPVALDALLHDLSDPQSPHFRQYLTPEQFRERFGASDAQVQTVVDFLESQDFQVTSIASNNLLIKAEGTFEKAGRAFGVEFRQFLLTSGRAAFANTSPPTLPADVAVLVAAIRGLDNTARLHPQYRLAPRVEEHPDAAACKPPTAADGFGPSDLQGAYGMTSLGLTGAGETVAVVEYDGFAAADPACYFSSYKLTPPSITVVNVDGGVPTPGAGAIEVDGDIEIVGGIAPGANILVYEEPQTVAADPNGTDLYTQIVTDDKASVVSISWGGCELDVGAAAATALDVILKQGATEGISFFAASGDAGAFDCDGDMGANDTKLAVDSPGADPYVTSVGGTNLTANGGVYGSEVVWGDPAGTGTCGGTPNSSLALTNGGGGGGVSVQFPAPVWQTATGVVNASCPANNMRQVPDVASDAIAPIAVTCTTAASQGCTGFGGFEGTSAAAPTWAAGMILVNEYMKSKGLPAVGYTNPALYAAYDKYQGAGFNDITVGDNLYYPATPGFDMASGLGSPIFATLATELVSTPVTTSTPTPTPTSTATPSPTPAHNPQTALVKGKSCSCDLGGSSRAGSAWLAGVLALGLGLATRRKLAAR